MIKKCIYVILICSMCMMLFNSNIVFARDEERAGITGNPSQKQDSSGDSIISGANNFIKEGEKQVNSKDDSALNEENLASTSNDIYNILLAIAIVVAVAVGVTLGIKFMISSVDDQAKIKEMLVPYVAGCIVVFGAMGIWKLAVTTFSKF